MVAAFGFVGSLTGYKQTTTKSGLMLHNKGNDDRSPWLHLPPTAEGEFRPHILPIIECLDRAPLPTVDL